MPDIPRATPTNRLIAEWTDGELEVTFVALDAAVRRAAVREIARTLDLWSDAALREEIDGWSMAEKCLEAALPVLLAGGRCVVCDGSKINSFTKAPCRACSGTGEEPPQAGGLPREPSEEAVSYAADQLAPLFLDDGEPVDPHDLVRYVARCLMIRDSGGYVSNVETCSPGLGGLSTDSLRWLAEQLQYRSEAHAKLIGDAVAAELASRSAGTVSGTT